MYILRSDIGLFYITHITSDIVTLTLRNMIKYTEWHKKRELLRNPTKIEEIQEKNLLTDIEPLHLAF